MLHYQSVVSEFESAILRCSGIMEKINSSAVPSDAPSRRLSKFLENGRVPAASDQASHLAEYPDGRFLDSYVLYLALIQPWHLILRDCTHRRKRKFIKWWLENSEFQHRSEPHLTEPTIGVELLCRDSGEYISVYDMI